jgi:hypothetical protein
MTPRCRGALCVAVVFAVVWSVFAPVAVLASGAAGAASFTIEDRLAPDQIIEKISVVIDGASVGAFSLTLDHPADTLHVSVPNADSYDYVLCGETTIRMPGGGEETHPVNDSGTLSDPDGRMYRAYNLDNVIFYLGDVSTGRKKAELKVHLGPRCPVPVAGGAYAAIG